MSRGVISFLNRFSSIRCLLLIAFGFLYFAALGQTNADSLWSVYRAKNAKPKERLHALRSLFDNNHIKQQPDTISKYAEEMIALAKGVGDKDMLASAQMNLGIHFSMKGEYTKSDSCYSLAESLIGRVGSPLLRSQILLNRGLSLAYRGLNRPAMETYERALVIADSLGDAVVLRALKNNMATLYAQSGDIAKAIELFTTVLQSAEALRDSSLMGNTLSNIGACNKLMGEKEKARPYFRKAIAVFEKSGNVANLPRPYFNLAGTFMGINADSVLHYVNLSIAAAQKTGDFAMQISGFQVKSEILGLDKNRPDSAMYYLQLAMGIAGSVNNPVMENNLKGSIARMEAEGGNLSKAISLVEEMLEAGQSIQNVELQKTAAEVLVEYYGRAGRHEKALEMFRLKVAMQDSLERAENQRELIRQEYKYDYEKQALADSLSFAAEKTIQQKEVQRQKQMRNGFMGGFVLVAVFAVVFFFQRNRISKARKRSDELLLNILPEEVAEELKETGEAEAKLMNEVTVLFTDFKGFTAMSERLSPKELVHDLHECFSAFDRICEKRGVEKIKTIGDAYMAAGGLPTPNATHAVDVVGAALEIIDFVEVGKAKKAAAGLPYFEIRVGIHTGPVVAGIVGVKKFSYDIWGDTVNTAARMESSGEEGRVNISESTFRHIKDLPDFRFTPRGKVAAKGKGEPEMFFVEMV